MSLVPAYIISARRSALGRVGGLHRARRLDALAAPVIQAALADASIAPDQVDELLLGNATEAGNPGRLLALAAGLPETAAAMTIDRQCASGLDAIVTAVRTIGTGAAEVVVAGGAESLSTAPWRIARPRNPYHTPHFIQLEPGLADAGGELQPFAASEALANKLGITRLAQDELAFASHQRAEAAREARRFVGEIVALRSNAEEARDQTADITEPDDLADAIPFIGSDGTLTPANTSALTDAAAFAVVVSEAAWKSLGQPPALRITASTAIGVSPAEEAASPIVATRRLIASQPGLSLDGVGVIEMSETSAAQVIAYAAALHIDPLRVSPEGGAVVRGHPLGASGAVLVARIFTALVRNPGPEAPTHGLATLGALGGIGVATLFERV
ncbi:MAG: thiolase family protein [Hyphomicrobiaceae bacterium]|nr:thiolase family protein [Hyphomicrobiaceae bacterium]